MLKGQWDIHIFTYSSVNDEEHNILSCRDLLNIIITFSYYNHAIIKTHAYTHAVTKCIVVCRTIHHRRFETLDSHPGGTESSWWR